MTPSVCTTDAPIPAFDYQRELAVYRSEVDAAIARVINSGWLILGPEVAGFEQAYAAVLGVPHAIGVASGTDALILALRALEIGAGARVITVANTAVPTVAAIRAVGAMPVFVDIDPQTLQISTDELEKLLDSCTSPPAAIIPVHLHGQPADMRRITELAQPAGIPIIGDCAQAHGAQIDSVSVAQWADINCFSFYPTKNLACLGDGGLCTTQSADLASRLVELRQYGFRGERVAHREGVCSRLDELQAAVLRVRLPRLEAAQAARQRIAARYMKELADCDLGLPVPAARSTHAWHQFVVRTPRRDQACAALQAARIGFGIHYPQPIHTMPAYKFLGYRSGDLPHTERLANEILSLPMFPGLREDEIERVIATLRRVFS